MQLSRLRALGAAYPEPDSWLLSPDTSVADGFCYHRYVVPHLLCQLGTASCWESRAMPRGDPTGWAGVLHLLSAWEVISDVVLLCTALAHARSKFVPVNEKCLQEMLFLPLCGTRGTQCCAVH